MPFRPQKKEKKIGAAEPGAPAQASLVEKRRLEQIERKRREQEKAKKKKTLARRKGAITATLKFVGGIIFALGTLATALQIYSSRPKLLIEPSPIAAKNNTFAPVHVTNKSMFSVYDVTLTSLPAELSAGYTTFKGGEFSYSNQTIVELGSEDSVDMECPLNLVQFYGPLSGKGPVVLSVSYRPSWWPWHIAKTTPFMLIRDADGKLHWSHRGTAR